MEGVEPTIGEKLEMLEQVKPGSEKPQPIDDDPENLPSADSIHVLLKQALRADDRALLMNCLSTKDDEIIENTTAQLNPSDALKLLDALVPMLNGRGTIVLRSVSWLRSLLLQNSSGILSQTTSSVSLNKLNQLTESRSSTLHENIRLISSIDSVLRGVLEEETGTDAVQEPIVFQDVDSDDESSDHSIETDEENIETNAVNVESVTA